MKQLFNYMLILHYLHGILSFQINYTFVALAAVAQWTECRPVNQSVASSIPSQGTCLG